MGVMFGTDGVRGVANKELSPELAFRIGRAGAYILSRMAENTGVVIGKDTRISGDMLEAALVAGICSAGVNVLKVGVMPTPAIAYLTRELKAAAGVVISASHNPVADNGIKFFGTNGYKLPDEVEAEIEVLVMDDCAGIPSPTGGKVGRTFTVPDAEDRYVAFATSTIDTDLKGLKVVVDCANGAACRLAPRVLGELGAEVIPVCNQPDGVNINEGCGSTSTGALQEIVVSCKAGLGLALDGDADRVIAVDADGRVVDGDKIMVICACRLKEQGLLAKNTIVVTVMSNLGLHLAMRKAGIQVLETKVGDRYVLEEMLRTGASLGGEQSGHIIFLDYNTTGDGILTSLQLLSVIKKSGRTLTELAAQMEQLPQLLENVPVKDKNLVMASPVLEKAIREQERRLGSEGRILVRSSGTEPLVRIMAEGRDRAKLQEVVNQLITAVKSIKN